MNTKEPKTPRRRDSKQRIIEAAETLFAEHGFDAVSIREITSHCGANVAAINYHFGGRDNLVTEIMLRYIRPINEERIARLETARINRHGKPIPLEEIIDAFVRPLITRIKKSDLSERLFHKLCARVFSQHSESLPENIEVHFQPVIERFTKSFAAALPDLDPQELVWRMHFMVGGMLHMMSHQDLMARMTHGLSGNPSIETTLSRFIRFAAAGFREGTASESTHDLTNNPQRFFDF